MPSNFDFLQQIEQYQLFARACSDAEKALTASPELCAIASRKAMELAVKWVYSADGIPMPYKTTLQALIHEPSFRFALDNLTWSKLPYIIKLGNLAVHTEKKTDRGNALLSLQALFDFIMWIDYSYGDDYIERAFDESLLAALAPPDHDVLKQKDEEIQRLLAKIAKLKDEFAQKKEHNRETRQYTPTDISEFMTRKKYIDVDIKLMGWTFGDDCIEEVPVIGMPNDNESGAADYVLYGKNSLPLAVVEAKRTSIDPKIGMHQAKLYADCLEKEKGQRPIIFTTNGFDTFIWDDTNSPERKVSGVFSKEDLLRLVNRRDEKKPLSLLEIDDRITDRYYQKEAVRAVCEHFEGGYRKTLLVMATGTGKTRTAASITDILSRGGWVTNILFLADRTPLVGQAKDHFQKYLPDFSLCNLVLNKEEKEARIVFSTYPTILNAIDEFKTEDGNKLFTPAHFDLIIVDEAHRSIFKKYRAIFEYFDAFLVGLTATPKLDVDHNTYDFFEIQSGVPTYAYDLETAVHKDKVLVDYHNIEVFLKFLEQGITYDELSEEDKQRYEEDFAEDDGEIPDHISSAALNDFIFNQHTVDIVLQNLMEKGIKVAGGDIIGKTIVFAQKHDHAMYIIERFNALYPQYKGKLAQVIDNRIKYAHDLINTFKVADKEPQVAISVDMLDTGIDVPEIVNLVFFKRIRSKTKFWQMIGRGTRLCEDLFGPDQDKEHFYIFDYLGNFEFFRANAKGIEGNETKTLTENIFAKRVRLIYNLQGVVFTDEDYQALRSELVDIVYSQIIVFNTELVAVRLRREFVEKYKIKDSFVALSEGDVGKLVRNLALLVFMDEADEYAKRFDNLIYSIMLETIEPSRMYKKYQGNVLAIMKALSTKMTIPQVKARAQLISDIQTEEFWLDIDILTLEKMRKELRDLVQFIVETGNKYIVKTALTDEVLMVKEGEKLDSFYNFEDYRLKVNRYIEENRDSLVIRKLRTNQPLTQLDYKHLEKILIGDLGTQEDYKREFGDTPFGLLVRKIAKLDREAANKVFSKYINEEQLTQNQMVFVRKIIDYIVENGYMDSPAQLMQTPFDKPMKITQLFDTETMTKILAAVKEIRENAVKVV
ncbi:MAG: DEAD/DEAH box helicase [Firmicutes bacterium HGW-Firmicutes-15]|nr:MAG: DEAD/DEAH box helicase [Firmicutes bacterium HGW-Firmicutes-15]